MTSFLKCIIQNNLPENWKIDSYDSKAYILVPLLETANEYHEVQQQFLQVQPTAVVVSINRVQHPSAYGRFLIRKEHLKKQNGHEPTAQRQFWYIDDISKIDTILEYNCDARRGGFSMNVYFNRNDHAIAVQKFMNVHERDSNIYPEYIIKYSTKSSQLNYDILDKFGRLNI